MRLLAVALVACACAPPIAPRRDEPPAPRAQAASAPVPADETRYYTLWLGGGRVGTATEREAWTADGVVVRRDEDLRFARGDAVVALHTAIEIAADRALAPSRVTWSELGTSERHDEAVRDDRGWHSRSGVALPADGVPAELVPLYVRRDGHFAGTVFLPARGFVAGAGEVIAIGAGRVVARLAFANGTRAEATIDLDAQREPVRIVDGEGVIAVRASQAVAGDRFPTIDLIAATAITIDGEPPSDPARGQLRIEGDLAVPALPGQRARPDRAGIVLALDAALPGELPPGPIGVDRTGDIAAMVADVQAQIAPDLAVGASSARGAADARAGDCTTFALAYASLASARGIPTQIVTGLRVDRDDGHDDGRDDGDRLVRHRWAISWTGRAWIAVDAAFGEAPAGGDLVGLAVHGADDAGLIAGESALTRVRAAAWVR